MDERNIPIIHCNASSQPEKEELHGASCFVACNVVMVSNVTGFEWSEERRAMLQCYHVINSTNGGHVSGGDQSSKKIKRNRIIQRK